MKIGILLFLLQIVLLGIVRANYMWDQKELLALCVDPLSDYEVEVLCKEQH